VIGSSKISDVLLCFLKLNVFGFIKVYLLLIETNVCTFVESVFVFNGFAFLLCSVTCILHWATYSQKVTCPQCKHPFEFLTVHRTLDGR